MTVEHTAPSAQGTTSVPKVMGILLIIFSSCYLFVSLLAAAGSFIGSVFMNAVTGFGAVMAQKGVQGAALADAIGAMQTVYRIQGLEKLVTAGLSGIGLAAGIGLLRYTARGLKLSFWWAAAALVYLVADTVIHAAVILPITTRVMEAVAKQVSSSMGGGLQSFGFFTGPAGAMSIAGILIVNCIMAVMPVLTIVFMTRGEVMRACGVDRILPAGIIPVK